MGVHTPAGRISNCTSGPQLKSYTSTGFGTSRRTKKSAKRRGVRPARREILPDDEWPLGRVAPPFTLWPASDLGEYVPKPYWLKSYKSRSSAKPPVRASPDYPHTKVFITGHFKPHKPVGTRDNAPEVKGSTSENRLHQRTPAKPTAFPEHELESLPAGQNDGDRHTQRRFHKTSEECVPLSVSLAEEEVSSQEARAPAAIESSGRLQRHSPSPTQGSLRHAQRPTLAPQTVDVACQAGPSQLEPVKKAILSAVTDSRLSRGKHPSAERLILPKEHQDDKTQRASSLTNTGKRSTASHQSRLQPPSQMSDLAARRQAMNARIRAKEEQAKQAQAERGANESARPEKPFKRTRLLSDPQTQGAQVKVSSSYLDLLDPRPPRARKPALLEDTRLSTPRAARRRRYSVPENEEDPLAIPSSPPSRYLSQHARRGDDRRQEHANKGPFKNGSESDDDDDELWPSDRSPSPPTSPTPAPRACRRPTVYPYDRPVAAGSPKSTTTTHAWSKSEDQRLLRLVASLGRPLNWHQIAMKLSLRTALDCERRAEVLIPLRKRD